MDIIIAGSAYIVMVEGVPHPVDKVTKACSCGGACNAPQLLEKYFASRIGHHCPICDAATTPHPNSKQIWVCPTDKTHYWVNRREVLRKKFMSESARMGGNASGYAPIEKPSQDGAAQAAVLPPEMPSMPEAGKSAP